MGGLRLFQFVPQPVKILVSPTNRIFWQVKLHPSTLQRRMEQNKHKGIGAYLGRRGGKNLSLTNQTVQENIFFSPNAPAKWQGLAIQNDNSGPQDPVKNSRIQNENVEGFHFYPQEKELNYPSELCSETFDSFPPSLTLRIFFQQNLSTEDIATESKAVNLLKEITPPPSAKYADKFCHRQRGNKQKRTYHLLIQDPDQRKIEKVLHNLPYSGLNHNFEIMFQMTRKKNLEGISKCHYIEEKYLSHPLS